MKLNDLTGTRFGRLVVLDRAGQSKAKQTMWSCLCDCGAVKSVDGAYLKRGLTKSCGCLQKEVVSARRRTHGQSKGRLHVIWCTMKARCSNQNSGSYAHYGARGISFCEEWSAFEPFQSWALANGYEHHLTLDRFPDKDGNYEPSNCRWATRMEQARNTRRNRAVVRSDGARFQTIAEAASATGCNQSHISAVLRGKRSKAGGYEWQRT